MIYLLFVFIAAISVIIIEFFSAGMGVLDYGDKFKIYKACNDDKVVPFKGKEIILITIICFALALAIQISLYKNTEIISFIKLYGLFLIVVCAAIIDVKRRIIPNILIAVGIVFRAALYVYEFFSVDNFKSVLINDLIGFVIGFVFLALISLLSKGALGFGDAKLFGVIGIICGSFCTYSTLLASLILSLAVSVINIARKKLGRKDSFPFGPCIAAGYIVAVFLTSY